MTIERFDELSYAVPAESPESYAERASIVLEDLIDNDPETAMYLMQPRVPRSAPGMDNNMIQYIHAGKKYA